MGGIGEGGRLFEAGRLLTFSAFSMGAYSRWALIRGWAFIRINTVPQKLVVISRLVIRVPKEPEEPEKSARRCSHFIDTSSMRRDEVLIYCTGLGVKESSTA